MEVISLAADGVGPRNVVGSKLFRLLIYIFPLSARGSSYLPSVERSAMPYDSSVRGPRKSVIFGESGGIERFQLASEFCALQLPNASASC